MHASWVYYEDFEKSIIVPLTDEQFVTLKRNGKRWEYTLPEYTKEELHLFKVVVLKWLSEHAIIKVGKHNDKICFKVTDFGKTIFES